MQPLAQALPGVGLLARPITLAPHGYSVLCYVDMCASSATASLQCPTDGNSGSSDADSQDGGSGQIYQCPEFPPGATCSAFTGTAAVAVCSGCILPRKAYVARHYRPQTRLLTSVHHVYLTAITAKCKHVANIHIQRCRFMQHCAPCVSMPPLSFCQVHT